MRATIPTNFVPKTAPPPALAARPAVLPVEDFCPEGDEATGFQHDRTTDALAKILEAFVAKELQPWVKTFPDDFYAQLENGDCLLHYLNEFRHNRPLPAILTAGYGGSGKSTVLKHYTTYKQPCKTYFSGDLSVGNFGKTSLILCEEAEKDSCKTLSLNKVKDMNLILKPRTLYSVHSGHRKKPHHR